jgi:hypothetical protein
LDAAAASKILTEIKRVAVEQRLIVVFTTSQPSTKLYDGFDQLMILTQGRQAFVGDRKLAPSYFGDIGYPCPENDNATEYFLSLVSLDLSNDETIEILLNSWEQGKKDGTSSTDGLYEASNDREDVQSDIMQAPHVNENGQSDTVQIPHVNFRAEVVILFRRQWLGMTREPALYLYLGRCILFLLANLFLAFVYWKVREVTQNHALNILWLLIWMYIIPATSK